MLCFAMSQSQTNNGVSCPDSIQFQACVGTAGVAQTRCAEITNDDLWYVQPALVTFETAVARE